MQHDQTSLPSDLIQAYQEEVAAAERFRKACVAVESTTENAAALEGLQKCMKQFELRRNKSQELLAEWEELGSPIDKATRDTLDQTATERTESLKRLLFAIRSAQQSLDLVRSGLLKDITEINRTTTIMKAYRS